MKGTPWSLNGNGDFQQLHYPGLSDFAPKDGQGKDKGKKDGGQQNDQDKAHTLEITRIKQFGQMLR